MKVFDRLAGWAQSAAATLAVLSSDWFEAAFSRLKFDDYYLLGPILLGIIGTQLSDNLVRWVINHAHWLRRLLCGQDNIEGDWVNIVTEKGQDSVKAAEYCRIRYKDGQYLLTGDTWNLAGERLGDFSSESSNYAGRIFEYYYKTGLNNAGGYGVIKFSPADGLPDQFVCRYVDEDSTPHVTAGQVRSRRFRDVPLEKRKAEALAFARRFEEAPLVSLEMSKARKLP